MKDHEENDKQHNRRGVAHSRKPGVPARPAFAGTESEQLAVGLEEAGRMLGVSAKTILREIHRGNLRAFKIGRQWRVRVAELDAYSRRMEVREGKRGGLTGIRFTDTIGP